MIHNFRRKESDEKLKRTLQALRASISGSTEQRKYAIEKMKLYDEQDLSKELQNFKAPKSFETIPADQKYTAVEPRYLEKKRERPQTAPVSQKPTFVTNNKNVSSRLLSHFEQKQPPSFKTARQQIEERKKAEKEKLKGPPHMTSKGSDILNRSEIPELTSPRWTPRTPKTPRTLPSNSRGKATPKTPLQTPSRNLQKAFDSNEPLNTKEDSTTKEQTDPEVLTEEQQEKTPDSLESK
jgi:hypothetical protein